MTGTSGTSDTVSRGPATPLTAQGQAPGAVEVVRSEEQLDVGRAVRVSGRAVLRRYVVTETVTQTFQVRHEEVRVDHEAPGSTDSHAVDASAFTDRTVEMVLHREVPVVQMQVQAVEVVRLHVDTVTTQVPVAAEVRKERVDLDAPGA